MKNGLVSFLRELKIKAFLQNKNGIQNPLSNSPFLLNFYESSGLILLVMLIWTRPSEISCLAQPDSGSDLMHIWTSTYTCVLIFKLIKYSNS